MVGPDYKPPDVPAYEEWHAWEEPFYTGTGFPGYGSGRDGSRGHELQRGFMINYTLYRHYFPLSSLGRVRKHFREAGA